MTGGYLLPLSFSQIINIFLILLTILLMIGSQCEELGLGPQHTVEIVETVQ